MVIRFPLTIALFFYLVTNSLGQKKLVLHWEVQHPITKEWIVLGERGSVQEALIKQGILPDPFYGENEKLFQWIESYEWLARAYFELTEEIRLADRVELEFPCIDTYATLWLNKKKIVQAENYFRPYHVEVRGALLEGVNEIEAIFTPPVRYHQNTYQYETFHYPAPNDNASIKAAPWTRKPQYQFGWDWAPRLNTMGFPFPVSLNVKEQSRLKSCVVNTISINDSARMELVLLKSDFVGVKQIRSKAFGWVVNDHNDSLQRISFSIPEPILWWPKEQGAQHLYRDTLILEDSRGKVLEIHPYVFGIRTVKLIQEKDLWGTSFAFEINGKRIFMKGGNFIPPSVFGGSIDKNEWESWVERMVKSHFNMVRIWGGGDYATDEFLDACDRAGLMVWQDAMFACAMYPGTQAFLENVKEELMFQLPRITKHPSVIYFNGNNEVDVAWKNWGFQNQYQLTSTDQAIIQKSYDTLFKSLIPRCLAAFSNLPYVHTSPLSNWGKAEYYNHGTQHYWGVWHGTDTIEQMAKNVGRFNAEFGFQSFPEFSTLSAFCSKDEWNLTSSSMQHHQKSYVGNQKMVVHAERLFGRTTGFDTLVYFSQLVQSHAMTTAIGAHLLDAPRCMGTLYWQLNDCWPAPTWSSIDYYKQWKAAHYKISSLYQEGAVLTKEDGDDVSCILVSNNEKFSPKTVHTNVYTLEGRKPRKIQALRRLISLDPFQSDTLVSYKKNEKLRLIVVEWEGQSPQIFLTGTLSSKIPVRYTLKVKKVDYKNHTAELVLKNRDFMADVWIYANSLGVHFNENFIHLLPGRHKIPFTFEKFTNNFNLMYR